MQQPLNLNQIEAVVTAYLDGHLHVEAYCGPAHAMAAAATAMAAELRRLRDRVLTESEYSAAWHAVEGAAGEEGADPGTVLHAVLDRLGIAWAAEETHVVADDSSGPETDTLPAWLRQRFDPHGPDWEQLSDDDRAYWEHHARAVRRAVARGGFKTNPTAQPAASRP